MNVVITVVGGVGWRSVFIKVIVFIVNDALTWLAYDWVIVTGIYICSGCKRVEFFEARGAVHGCDVVPNA